MLSISPSVLCFAATKSIFWPLDTHRSEVSFTASCNRKGVAFPATQFAYCRFNTVRNVMKMSTMTDSSQVIIEPLSTDNPEDLDLAAKALVDSFSRDDPHTWSGALKMPADGFSSYVQQYIPSCAAQEPGCLVARASTIAGVLCLEDFNAEEKTKGDDEAVHPWRRELDAMLGKCGKIFADGLQQRLGRVPQSQVGTIAYFAFLAVPPQARNRGIGEALVSRGLESMRKKGFRYALAYCVSPRSTRIFQRQGFECWGAVVYAEVDVDASASIPDECTVMVKRLDG